MYRDAQPAYHEVDRVIPETRKSPKRSLAFFGSRTEHSTLILRDPPPLCPFPAGPLTQAPTPNS